MSRPITDAVRGIVMLWLTFALGAAMFVSGAQATHAEGTGSSHTVLAKAISSAHR